MAKIKNLTGLELVLHLQAEHSNEWCGGDEPEKIATSRYAVVIERGDDGWVLGADNGDELAAIELGCRESTEGYDESVTAVFDVASGELVAYTCQVSVMVVLNGEAHTARAGRA